MDGSGIAVGIGAGIAIGVGAGRKAAVDAIRNYVHANHITIQRAGTIVAVESFLAEAVKTDLAGKKKALVIALLVLGVALLLAIVLYVMQR
jgi:hypothetical protein